VTSRSILDPIRIRPMKMEDVGEVHQIDVLSFSLPWTERSFRFELTENPTAQLWVAELLQPEGKSRIIGMMVIWLIIDEAHIGSIAIHPDFRQQGIGKKLLLVGLIEASRKGAVQATLEVRRGNLPAQTLYRQLGFSVVGVRPHYYRDNGEDALLMTLHEMDADRLSEQLDLTQNSQTG